jgi:hypothetical protein
MRKSGANGHLLPEDWHVKSGSGVSDGSKLGLGGRGIAQGSCGGIDSSELLRHGTYESSVFSGGPLLRCYLFDYQ